MPLGDYTQGFLIAPHTLKKLAGLEVDDSDILEDVDQEEFFSVIDEETTSVEVVTLAQYKYEQAFEYLTSKIEYAKMELEDIAEAIESILYKFDNLQPHVFVDESEIRVVLECDKIDAHKLEIATRLLAKLPSSEPGFYWDYTNSET